MLFEGAPVYTAKLESETTDRQGEQQLGAE